MATRARKASAFWDSPLPLAIVAVLGAAGVVWWRKKQEAESLASIQGF